LASFTQIVSVLINKTPGIFLYGAKGAMIPMTEEKNGNGNDDQSFRETKSRENEVQEDTWGASEEKDSSDFLAESNEAEKNVFLQDNGNEIAQEKTDDEDPVFFDSRELTAEESKRNHGIRLLPENDETSSDISDKKEDGEETKNEEESGDAMEDRGRDGTSGGAFSEWDQYLNETLMFGDNAGSGQTEPEEKSHYDKAEGDNWDHFLNQPSSDAPDRPEFGEDSFTPPSGEDDPYSMDWSDTGNFQQYGYEALETMHFKLDKIQEDIQRLEKDFEGKLKYDSHKNKIIDELHQELQDYKQDVVKKYLKSMIMDLIKIIDNIRRLGDHYQNQDPAEQDPSKLLKILKSIPSDLEDLIYLQGIKPFREDTKEFIPSRQRVLKKYKTHDKSLDKTVAKTLHPGYEWDGKVIRPEMVAVYVFSEPPVE
jgi:molecular chaperone GrpE (heat shock protein)